MVHIADIHRHPLKGWTPESLERAKLEVGGGLPLDRHFAFTCGRLEDEPKPGSWVQPRTFLMLTFFPELAAFRAVVDDAGVLTVTAPDGSTAQARVGDPDGFGAADAFIQRYFEGGPFGKPRLVEKIAGYGHWDFSDTKISLINMATVRVIEEAAGRPLERERFRGNIYLEGLDPWAEFDWPGRQLSIGSARLDVLRPIQRCAMTSTEPGTGKRDFDLPAIMDKTFGHKFCGVYASVSAAGEIAQGDEVSCGSDNILNPYEHLPDRVADPALWPRFAAFEPRSHGLVHFVPVEADWPLLQGTEGQGMRILRVDPNSKSERVPVVEAGPDGLLCHVSCPLPDNGLVLINGPFGRA